MACMGYELNRKESENKTHREVLAFGRPWKHTTAIIVNQENQVVPIGEEGELCFSGDHVMQGYWQLAEKNESIFFESEVDGIQRRFYKSGDMAFQDEAGDFYSCGRLDHQYKIQGYKVELGEIEQLARQFFNGIAVAAVVKQKENALLEIHLFIETTEIEFKALMEFLISKLPQYMLPKKIHGMDLLPRNLSGKLDRRALLDQLLDR